MALFCVAEHPIHSMYFITGGKLKIAGPPTPTKLGEEGGVAEIPPGAAPIFPAMAHQVAPSPPCRPSLCPRLPVPSACPRRHRVALSCALVPQHTESAKRVCFILQV